MEYSRCLDLLKNQILGQARLPALMIKIRGVSHLSVVPFDPGVQFCWSYTEKIWTESPVRFVGKYVYWNKLSSHSAHNILEST